jgi:hypothetical protein
METVAAPLAEPSVRAPARVGRTITVSGADLAPFQAPAAIAAGQVLLISLETVADALGAGWQGRRTEVYDRAGRVLAKRLAIDDAFLRISETDFLLIQTAPRPAAEEKAVRALGEIVAHFLGETDPEALRLFTVNRVNPTKVLCGPLDAGDILARADLRTVRDEPASADILSGERWAPFVTTDGRKVRPSCVLEPVFEIAGRHRIGYRLRRKLVDVASGEPLSFAQQHSLTRADTLRIDRATLARGIERLNSAVDGEAALSLIMPVSYFSLTHPEAGAHLSRMFARARHAVSAGVICEIYDIEGISQSALAAAIAVVRPWSLFVTGHLTEETPRATPAMKAAGIQVLSFTAPPAMESDAEFIGWLSPALRGARRVGRSVMVYGCHSQRRMALAGVLGATHASLTT